MINLSFLSVDLFIDQLLNLLFQVNTEKSHAYVLSLFNSKSTLLAAYPVWLLEFFILCLSVILCQQQRQGMAIEKLLAMKLCSVHTTEISIAADACFCWLNYIPFDKSGPSGAAVYLFKGPVGCDYIPIGYPRSFLRLISVCDVKGCLLWPRNF